MDIAEKSSAPVWAKAPKAAPLCTGPEKRPLRHQETVHRKPFQHTKNRPAGDTKAESRMNRESRLMRIPVGGLLSDAALCRKQAGEMPRRPKSKGFAGPTQTRAD